MKYGLSSYTIDVIREVFNKHPLITHAILYGSRAKGNFRPNSDIDLTLKGDGLDLTILMKIEAELDDLLLPYKIDLSMFSDLTNVDLIDHINRVGVVFYEKPMNSQAEQIVL